jgi:hypothetical protein
MPSLSSFVNSSQYTKENLNFPFLTAMKLGTGYVAPSFTGVGGAANNDPGGLFGWLIYGRSLYTTPKGATTDQYLVYTNPYDLVGDLNQLSGITSCLVSGTAAGGTFGFFTVIDTELSPKTAGTQFLHAINYLAYGGTLVVAGKASGFSEYTEETGNYFDLMIDPFFDSSVASWFKDQPYTMGIYPTTIGSEGITGGGYTLTNFTTLFGGSQFVTGITVAGRVFNVCGLKTATNLDTSSIQENTKLTYTIQATNDVGGFFARAKNRNESYLTVAGLDRATVINGNIINPIDWAGSLKTTLRTNRANFFVNYNPKFLGSDLVGATANTSIGVNDRVGPTRMRVNLTKDINTIALKYVFDINNQTTRDQVVSEVQTALDPYAPFIDTTQTQIICDASNNADNSSTLNIDVIVKPILTTDSFLINVSYTQ